MPECTCNGVREERSDQLMLRIMADVNGQVFRMFGNKVLGGPFTGMIIPERNEHWDDGNSSVKLLGVYEHELRDVIDHASWRRPRILINVGAAEGYYAIGFARSIGNLQVYAFDTNAGCRLLCEQLAEKNGVADQVEVLDGCNEPEQMSAVNSPAHKLYILDCEGYELNLVDPIRCPSICHSDLIIECHDFLNPAISATLADRLEATHTISLIQPRLPDFNQFSFVRRTPNVMSVLALTEKRPMPCYWLACWAKQKDGS